MCLNCCTDLHDKEIKNLHTKMQGRLMVVKIYLPPPMTISTISIYIITFHNIFVIQIKNAIFVATTHNYCIFVTIFF